MSDGLCILCLVPACTLHEVDTGIDTGVILKKKFVPLCI